MARDLEMLGVPAANWPANIEDATGQPVLDVLVVGAGMNGIAAAGSLMFKGVRNIAVVERSQAGSGRALADLRAHGHAALAQDVDGPRARRSLSHLSRLV